MTETKKCPDRTAWQLLLEGNLSEQTQQELTAHLDSCPACRQAVDQLAAAGQSWSKIPAALAKAGGQDVRLAEVMAQLKSDESKLGETLTQPGTADSQTGGMMQTSSTATPHERLGHYQIREVIGKGGMGVVLKAYDEKLQRIVAIKIMAPELAANATARTRFIREARAAAAVSHDHIVTIHAVEEGHSPPYFVMQYVVGTSLEERLEKKGPFGVKEILRIGLQAAYGLSAAHAHGLVHRDIKPANILLENGVERVKITDFGLARAVDDASVTQSGVISGTPMFMSPEQASGETVDHRSDLFSLGSVLYMLCTGRPPFRATSTYSVMKRVIEDRSRSIRELNPEIPDWLEAIIAKLHAKKPEDRFQTAKEVAQLLEQHLAHLQQPGKVPMPEIVQRPEVPARAPSPKPSLLVAAILIVFALLVPGLAEILSGDWRLLFLSIPAAGGLMLAGLIIVVARLLEIHKLDTKREPAPTFQQAQPAPGAVRPRHWALTAVFFMLAPLFLVPVVLAANLIFGGMSDLLFGVIIVAGAGLTLIGLTIFFLVVGRLKAKPATASSTPVSWRRFVAPALLCLVLLLLPVVLIPWLPLYLSNHGRVEIEPQEGLTSVNVLQNDVTVHDWMDMRTPHTVTLSPGKYHMNAGLKPGYDYWTMGWELKISGLFSNRTVRQAGPGCDFEVQRGERVTVKTIIRKVPEAPPVDSTDSKGFVQLFNGKNLTGWMLDPNQPGEWSVDNGVLIGRNGPGHLYTIRDDYRNFHLRAEASISKGAASDIYFRAKMQAPGPKGSPRNPSGYVVDMNAPDSFVGPISYLNPQNNSWTTQGAYSPVKPDEWFTLDLIADGNHLVSRVNGIHAVDFVEPLDAYPKGHIALEVWTPETVIKFRKIEIKELPSSATPAKPESVIDELRLLVTAEEKAVERERLRQQAGFSAPLELTAAEIKLLEARVRLAEAENDIAAKVARLAELIGQHEKTLDLIKKRVAAGTDAPVEVDRGARALAEARVRLAAVSPAHPALAGPIDVADQPNDQKKLQGTWRAVSMEQNGMKTELANPNIPMPFDIVLTFTDDKCAMTIVDRKDGKAHDPPLPGVFHLNPQTNPKQISIIAPVQKPSDYGIYRLEGDTLTVCHFTAPPKDVVFPTEFTGKQGSGTTLMVFRRERTPPRVPQRAADILPFCVGSWKTETVLLQPKVPADIASSAGVSNVELIAGGKFLRGYWTDDKSRFENLIMQMFDPEKNVIRHWLFRADGEVTGPGSGVFDPDKKSLLYMEKLPNGNQAVYEFDYSGIGAFKIRLFQQSPNNDIILDVRNTFTRLNEFKANKMLSPDPKRPPEIKVLERLTGDWREAVNVKNLALGGKPDVSIGVLQVRPILAGRFVEMAEHNEAIFRKSHWLATYDAEEKKYRCWWFRSDSRVFELWGTWDETKQSMHWLARDNSIRGDWNFKNDDECAVHYVFHDGSGKPTLETAATLTRVPAAKKASRSSIDNADIAPKYRQAIANGLAYLAKEQKPDGHWEATGGQYTVSMTAHAGMAMLMEGSTQDNGKYAVPIRKAVDWLMECSQPHGLLNNPKNSSDSQRYMFGHGYAMLFLSTIYSQEKDGERERKLAKILSKAVEFTGEAQVPGGGWGYIAAKEGKNFDESATTICQLQALRAARNAGIVVPRKLIDADYLRRCTSERGAIVYSLSTPDGGDRPALSAAAAAAGEYDSDLVRKWLHFCQQTLPLDKPDLDLGFWDYTHYYFAQAVYLLGDNGYEKLFPKSKPDEQLTWSKYRSHMFKFLLSKQNADGSWNSGGVSVGAVYSTACCLTILQLDNAAVPAYQR